MTQDQREHLSAGIDGELAREELRFLLRRFEHDAELGQAWTRYHLARDGLRRQLPAVASAGFAARVAQAIAQESEAKAGRRAPHWLRWSAGGAIAASVAVAAFAHRPGWRRARRPPKSRFRRDRLPRPRCRRG
jgi:sigma-E factor negative regulatory protein RseA